MHSYCASGRARGSGNGEKSRTENRYKGIRKNSTTRVPVNVNFWGGGGEGGGGVCRVGVRVSQLLLALQRARVLYASPVRSAHALRDTERVCVYA